MSKRRFFIDCEFVEDGHTIELISVGIYCENGKKFYRESGDLITGHITPWLWEHVMPLLSVPPYDDEPSDTWRHKHEIAAELLEFVTDQCDGAKPEFWGDWAAYDWVAVCQLYGPMIDLPEGWPYFCRDTEQLRHDYANDPHYDGGDDYEPLVLPDFYAPNGLREHHALDDAIVSFLRWGYMMLWAHLGGTMIPDAAHMPMTTLDIRLALDAHGITD